jgi:chloramphenicol 3-O phosphotransferase
MIILLNGASSSGKTSLALAIQHLSNEPWLRLGVDTFVEMMPHKYLPFGTKAEEGFRFIPGKNDKGPLMMIEAGQWGKKVFSTLPLTVNLLANHGNNVIVDEVLLSEKDLQNYINACYSHKVYFIGVFCDLSIMQEREILRHDRAIGLSNDQLRKVHPEARAYDMKIDATNQTSFVLASSILDFINVNPNPQAFIKNHKCH